MATNNDIIVDRLKIYLKENNFTYREFAEMIGVSEVTISRWIHGKRNIRAKYYKIIETIIDDNTPEDAYLLSKMNINIILKYINSLDIDQRKNIVKIIIDDI